MGITLLSPWALLALPAAAALLVYVYRTRGKGTQRVVATLMLMRDLAKPRMSRQKFFPPPRFFLELLLILLLVLGLSGIATLHGKKKIVIVVDNSLSTMAKAGEGGFSETFLELEKRDAEGVITSASADTRFKVYELAPSLRSSSTEWLSASEAVKALGEIRSVWGDDNLAQALTKLSSTETDTKIVAFTDLHLLRGGSDHSEVHSLISESKAPCNISITALSYIGEKVEVELTSFCNHTVQATVTIEQLLHKGGEILTPASLRWVELEGKKVQLSSEDATTLSFATHSRDAGAYKIHLKTNVAADNVLQEDDIAWIAVAASRNELTIVSPLAGQKLGLGGVRNTTFNFLSPADIEREGLQAYEKFPEQPILFHRVVPAVLPNRDLLFFAPPNDNELLGTKSFVESAPLVRWEATNPLLAYLNLEGVVLPRATVLEVPVWAHSVASVGEGSILYEGEVLGKRRVVAGFELLPFEGGKRPLLSIFFLNLMRSIVTVQGEVGFNRAPMILAETREVQSARYLDGYSAGENSALPPVVHEAESNALLLPAPGLVQSEPAPTLYALNFINPSEGNFMQSRSAKVLAENIKAKPAAHAYSDYAQWCAWGALFILLLDLFFPTLLSLVRHRTKVFSRGMR